MADAARIVKRFYKQAEAKAGKGGHEILLDARPVKTPGRAALIVPTRPLADAVAAEWNAQGEEIDPRSMPFTGLANAAIDRVAPDPAAFARGLALFGESDLLCYRADGPAALVARQAEHWDPLLAWARRRHDVEIETITGIMHRRQPERTVEQLARAVAARDAFALAGLSPLVTLSGSLILALALAEGAIELDAAWQAATVDERFQVEFWGEDEEAAAVFEGRRREFAAGFEFIGLL